MKKIILIGLLLSIYQDVLPTKVVIALQANQASRQQHQK
ncbi:Uncharacterised protein [Enterococcus faecalis]|uniref:Uncharacterized protein n=1 Tax=Enterococcus faecalis TaxID=1351 RepID=A0AAX2KUD8_ENTFL|nr:Uncharacterised protein [Enterococcus faecalis]